MLLNTVDWTIVIVFFVISLGIGLWAAKFANKDTADYFTGGGKMPWWLLGISMVATTFSTDTPNLVTNIVRKNGVAGNWEWWVFLLTGLLTVFIYARLWKKSGVITDVEFYELRYSGKIASFLRGFRALYLGFFFNIMIMASVSLAAIKISGVLLGLNPEETIMIAGAVTVIYSSLGGLTGVLFTDFIQFFLSIGGALVAAWIALDHPKVGGLSGLLSNPQVQAKLDMFPDPGTNPELFLSVLLVPLLVQWWSVWYPGAEPGGGGYIAQRMFAAKNENNAVKSVFLFNIMHYALRPWPWIIVALCSIVVFPDMASMTAAFPTTEGIASDDMGYPAMLTFLPHGILGLVITSLMAAYMSTISTHLNWGSSYIVNDFYRRFIRPEGSEKEFLNVGRITTVLLMIFAMLLALQLENALETFGILLQIGAGTGLIFILRWFWWRVNAASEIAAMISSFVIALYFAFAHEKIFHEELASWMELVIGVGLTTFIWVVTAYVTSPANKETLYHFLKVVKPGGPGWKKIVQQAKQDGHDVSALEDQRWKVPVGIICMIYASIAIYSLMIGTGYFIYGNILYGSLLLLLAIICGYLLSRKWDAILDKGR
jgi:Na+/proline symporter